ncbi:MAG TPA: hypothetical protein VN520_27420 [Streptomyces sp.]|nr:hypothetical protein [Streptomyces sp.]HWU10061.1 hypothetical protein [Streptomyces sp.]
MTHLRTERTRARTLFTAFALALAGNSYYRDVRRSYQADATAELVQRGSILENTTGRTGTWGAAFEPRDFSPRTLDRAADVPELVTRGAGPQKHIGTAPHRTHH